MNYKLIGKIDNTKSVTEQILLNRGLTYKQLYHYTHTTDLDLYSPLLFPSMKRGAALLLKHIEAEEDIYIQPDSDCDGYLSSAMLINYLNKLFPTYCAEHIKFHMHDLKIHGINLEVIPKNTKLVIIPDAGSNDEEQCKILAEQGVDVLILDHHEADKIIKEACIINNQLCDYPTKGLCGAAVVWKFCCYLDKIANTNYAEDLVDLAAVGIIGDVMPLNEFEVRHIVSKGMLNIKNPLLKYAVEEDSFHFDNNLNPNTFAFYLVPLINAVTRTGTYEDKELLFKALLESEAYDLRPSTKRGAKAGDTETIVAAAYRNSTNVKSHQSKKSNNSFNLAEEKINQFSLLENKVLIVRFSPEDEVEESVTGLIANQLMSKYKRPILVLNKKEEIKVDENTGEVMGIQKVWKGSGRGYEKSQLKDFKGFLLQFPEVIYAQGHKNAFGFCIADSDFQSFVEKINETLKDFNFSTEYLVDFIFNTDEVKPQDILDIGNMKDYWGKGIEEALVVVENIAVTKENLMLLSKDKNPTLKITLSNGVNLMKFKSSVEEYESLTSDGCVIITIVGKCSVNEYRGNITPQIFIEDYEIISRNEYFF